MCSLQFLIFFVQAHSYFAGHTKRTSAASRSHSSPQYSHQHLNYGLHYPYGHAEQYLVQYSSPMGILVGGGMRGPGSETPDASPSVATSLPVISVDQHTNARYACATCNKRFNRPSSLRVGRHSFCVTTVVLY